MTNVPPARSPLACLVLFLVLLALAGSILAAVHYAAVDLPAQKAISAPHNGQICYSRYSNPGTRCYSMANTVCAVYLGGSADTAAFNACMKEYGCC